MRVAIIFAYDGSKFNGYARQPNLITIEGELINSLVKFGFIDEAKDSCFRSASRTDKDVSALCNVVAFNTDVSKKNILHTLSNEFSSIIVYGIKEVELEFNPRHARLRHYRYNLPSNNLDLKKIISTSACFTGEHDFTNFAKLESFKNPVRTIDNIIFTLIDNFLIVDFYARTFLWHQIRKIMSALIKIGNNKLEKEQIIKALKNPDKRIDFGLAHADPLVLMDIVYDFDFEYNDILLCKIKNIKNNYITNKIFLS